MPTPRVTIDLSEYRELLEIKEKVPVLYCYSVRTWPFYYEFKYPPNELPAHILEAVETYRKERDEYIHVPKWIVKLFNPKKRRIVDNLFKDR